MKKCTIPYTTAIAFAFIFVSHALNAQDWKSKIPQDAEFATLRVFDASGIRTELYFGFHSEGTYGYDINLGESPIPPVPIPVAFESRFLDLPGQDRNPPGGCYIDIRGIRGHEQRDTFMVRAQPLNGAYPITIAWDGSELSTLLEAATMEYRNNANEAVEIDMMSKHYTMFEEGECEKVSIITVRKELTFMEKDVQESSK